MSFILTRSSSLLKYVYHVLFNIKIVLNELLLLMPSLLIHVQREDVNVDSITSLGPS